MAKVCRRLGLSVAELRAELAGRPGSAVCRAREQVATLGRHHGYSYPQIARALDMHHTGVMLAERRAIAKHRNTKPRMVSAAGGA